MDDEINKPLCFVIIGYGEKNDYPRNRKINLDKTYDYIIKPAVEKADYECIKCNEIKGSGLIDKDMFQYLYDAELVIADITTLNANALYELGIRHGVKPFSTIIMAQDTEKLPFDFNHNRIFRYNHMGPDIGCSEADKKVNELYELIKNVKENPETDSPFYIFTGVTQLLELQKLQNTTSFITTTSNSKDIALLPLFGKWNDLNEKDKQAIKKTICLSDDDYKNLHQFTTIPNSSIQLNNTHWQIIRTNDSKELFTQYITPSILKEYETIAVTILSDIDTKFELPKENRFMANLYNKKTIYSKDIRKGICESLVWLSLNKELLLNNKYLVSHIVFSVLSKEDWHLWASLNDLLPILAEAEPDTFLKCLQKQITENSEMINELFNQEGDGITGTTLMSGILWSLETIAWFPNLFQPVCLCLAELTKLDKGGVFSNRPIKSLKNLLLPWINNCNVKVDEKIKTVEKLLEDYSEISWSLIFGLMPSLHSITMGIRKPVYNLALLENYSQSVTKEDYQLQIKRYSELIVKLMKEDDNRIFLVLDNLSQFNTDCHEEIFEYINTKEHLFNDNTDQIDELWEQVTELIRKHKKFINAKWAYDKETIKKIECFAIRIEPTDKKVLYKYLFALNEYDISEEPFDDNNKTDWAEIRKKAMIQRKKALKDLVDTEKFHSLNSFIQNDFMAKTVAETLSDFKQKSIDKYLIYKLEEYNTNILQTFVKHYFLVSSWNRNEELQANVEFSKLPDDKKLFILLNSKFEQKNWELAEKQSEMIRSEYWKKIDQNIYASDSNLEHAIKEFNKVSRTVMSLKCIYTTIQFKKSDVDINLIFETLNKNLLDQKETADAYELIEIFKYLEKSDKTDRFLLADYEWAFYVLFKYDNNDVPKALYQKMANTPSFYVDLIKLGYCEDDCKQKPVLTEEETAKALNSWDVLRNFNIIPGLGKDGILEPETFKVWINKVIALGKQNKRIKTIKNYLGQLLYHAPKDKSGLWIDKTIAGYLDSFDNDRMRDGFRTKCINSRGCYTIDTTGETEKNISDTWMKKANELRNNNFNMFANEIEKLAQFYLDSAEQSKQYVNLDNMALEN